MDASLEARCAARNRAAREAAAGPDLRRRGAAGRGRSRRAATPSAGRRAGSSGSRPAPGCRARSPRRTDSPPRRTAARPARTSSGSAPWSTTTTPRPASGPAKVTRPAQRRARPAGRPTGEVDAAVTGPEGRVGRLERPHDLGLRLERPHPHGNRVHGSTERTAGRARESRATISRATTTPGTAPWTRIGEGRGVRMATRCPDGAAERGEPLGGGGPRCRDAVLWTVGGPPTVGAPADSPRAARSTILVRAVPPGADFARPQTATPVHSDRRPPVGDDPRSQLQSWVGSRADVRAAGTRRPHGTEKARSPRPRTRGRVLLTQENTSWQSSPCASCSRAASTSDTRPVAGTRR